MNVVSTRHTAAPTISGSTVVAEPGTTLMREALDLLERRKWRPALTVLESARHLRPNDPAIDELVIIAAAHGQKVRPMAKARQRVLDRPEQTASSCHALAVAALVQHDYPSADRFARQAIEIDPESAAAWSDLATSFAGLGWFDEATDCLTTAADHGGVAPLQQWRLGRAVNHWALAQNQAFLFTAIATVLVGLLALAVGLSVPLVIREFRVGRLPEPFKGAAEWHWRTEHRLKLAFGFGVLVAVAGFVASLYYLPGAA